MLNLYRDRDREKHKDKEEAAVGWGTERMIRNLVRLTMEVDTRPSSDDRCRGGDVDSQHPLSLARSLGFAPCRGGGEWESVASLQLLI